MQIVFFCDIEQIQTVQIKQVAKYKPTYCPIQLDFNTSLNTFSIKIMGKSINEKELGELQGEGGSDVFTTTRHVNHNQQQQVSNLN